VYGVGVNDLNQIVQVNGKILPTYRCWRDMLKRCYSAKALIKNLTYIGCSVSEEWKTLSNFKEWYDANYRECFELDKDILYPGNKIYSADTCCFVPHYLNSLLIDCGASRGDLPLGVTEIKPNNIGRISSTYLAQCSDGYGARLTKTFKTIEEAQAWYSITKKRIVAEQVHRAWSNGDISAEVAMALLKREF
jgi:hypothetical protein